MNLIERLQKDNKYLRQKYLAADKAWAIRFNGFINEIDSLKRGITKANDERLNLSKEIKTLGDVIKGLKNRVAERDYSLEEKDKEFKVLKEKIKCLNLVVLALAKINTEVDEDV